MPFYQTPRPAGGDTQVQFNDGGLFGGSGFLTFNKSTNVLSLGGSFFASTGSFQSTSNGVTPLVVTPPFAGGQVVRINNGLGNQQLSITDDGSIFSNGNAQFLSGGVVAASMATNTFTDLGGAGLTVGFDGPLNIVGNRFSGSFINIGTGEPDVSPSGDIAIFTGASDCCSTGSISISTSNTTADTCGDTGSIFLSSGQSVCGISGGVSITTYGDGGGSGFQVLGRTTLNPWDSSSPILRLAAKSFQSGNYIEFLDSTGTAQTIFDSNGSTFWKFGGVTTAFLTAPSGAFQSNTAWITAGTTLTSSTTSSVPVNIRGTTGQTADLTQWKNPANTSVLLSVQSDGSVVTPFGASGSYLLLGNSGNSSTNTLGLKPNGSRGMLLGIGSSNPIARLATDNAGIALNPAGVFSWCPTGVTANEAPDTFLGRASGGGVLITNSFTGQPQLVLKQTTSQTADVFELQNSTSQVLGGWNSSGTLFVRPAGGTTADQLEMSVSGIGVNQTATFNYNNSGNGGIVTFSISGTTYCGIRQFNGFTIAGSTPLYFAGSAGTLSTRDTAILRQATKILGLVDGFTTTNPGGTLASIPNSPAQITADQNNYAPGTARYQRLTSDASRTITGLSVSQVDGMEVFITNVGSNNLVLSNQNASSTATNRFLFSTGADITLAANKSIRLFYDNTTGRWRDL
jgi:hypothetical protein